MLIEVKSPPAAVAARCREILSRNRNIESTTEKRGLLDLRRRPKKLSGRSSVNGDIVTAKTFLKMLDTGKLDSEMTNSVGRRLPLDECKRLAAEFDARPDLEGALARANPNDRWATEAIPALGAWLRGGRSPGSPVRTVTAEFDFLERAEMDGKTWSFPMLLNGLRRQAVQPTRQACVLATARNEGIYLVEWIAHHRAMGFEAFFIYTNDNTDGSDQLLEILASEGVINLIHNQVGPSVGPQYKAYGHALQFVPDILDYKWVSVIDIDEFVRINRKKFASIVDYLNWSNVNRADSIGLSWKIFGPNKQVCWRDAPLNQRFSGPDQNSNDHLKCTFKPGRFFGSQCHFPYDVKYEPRVYCYSNGAQISEGPFYTVHDYEYAWIDHFHLKSLEEMAVRRSRSHADRPVAAEMNEASLSTGLVGLYLDTYDLEAFVDPSPDDALDERRQAEIEKLMALPGVSAAVDRCKAAFQAEVRQIKSILAESPRFQTPGTPEARMLELLLSRP